MNKEVKVWSDMGHLCYEPTEVPEDIHKQIGYDVRQYHKPFKMQNGQMSKLVHYELKPHVPLRRAMHGYIIDYSQIASKTSRMSWKHINNGGAPVYHINNLLSDTECNELISLANNLKDDNLGNRSWHKPGTGGKYSRVIWINKRFATELWYRIKSILPEYIDQGNVRYKLAYLNDHFRFSRYRKGGIFPIHCDGKNHSGRSESVFTLNIFLNTKPKSEGGGTTFYQDPNDASASKFTIPPIAGSAALFWANQYHSGDTVHDGLKYLLRTDVMAYGSRLSRK